MAAYSSAVVRFESVGFVRETKIEFLDQIEDRLGRIVESGKPEGFCNMTRLFKRHFPTVTARGLAFIRGPSLTCRLHPQQR